MITIYKDKKDIPNDVEYVELNDIFFNKNTSLILDKQAAKYMKQIDEVKPNGKFKIKSRFDGVTLGVDCLSTGCKTVLNVLYYPDKVFCLKECGDNALGALYSLRRGAVYSDYALIPFDMKSVQVCDSKGTRTIKNYEELKEWWSHEK